jgi:hypothetical protein
MRGHVVGPFSVVAPSGVLGREAIECRRDIREHGGIGIFLDRQRRRGVTDEQRHRALLRAGFPGEFRGLGGKIDEATPRRLHRQQRADDGFSADPRQRGTGE